MGFSIYFLLAGEISKFINDIIKKDIERSSREVYNIVDQNFNSLNKNINYTLKDANITKALTIGAIEDSLRLNEYQAIIYIEATKEVVYRSSDIVPETSDLIEKTMNTDEVIPLNYNKIKYNTYHVYFKDWQWNIVLIKDAKDYTDLLNTIRYVSIIAFLFLFVTAILLIIILNYSIKIPLNKIINPIKKDNPPAYIGIYEFEFLSDSIRIMMTSLKEKTEWIQKLLSTVGALIIAFDSDGKIVMVNKTVESATGYTSEEVMNKFLWDFLIPTNMISQVKTIFYKISCHQASDFYEHPLFTKYGKEMDLLWKNSVITGDNNEIKWIIYTGIDITERKNAERALASEKELLSTTLRSIGDGVITTNLEGNIVLFNKVAEKLTGWMQNEALGQDFEEVFKLINEETKEPLESPIDRVFNTGGLVFDDENAILIDKNGGRKLISHSGAPIRNKDSMIIGVVIVFRDVTEKQKIEEDLRKAHKLESIGILAGGIAHDFNNILTAILGNISLSKLYAEPNGKVFNTLTEAEKGTLRARDLTQQLLTFSKGGAPIKKTASISELITETVDFILTGSNVKAQYVIPKDIWPVDIDVGQISQVVNNLTINAVQAMHGGGIFMVYAENVVLRADNTRPIKEGKYVRISFLDHGAGIPPESLAKIFDPYFTTKVKGNGLGLATSYSIVKKHGGYIDVESEVGVGTTFHIFLPASEKSIAAMIEHEAKVEKGTGKILLMDDEEIVREVASEMLMHLEYEVDCAEDGEKAINLYKKSLEANKPYDVIIMDLTIPGGLGGKETIDILRGIDPDVSAIVSSGYSTDPIMSNYEQYGFKGVVAKPYKISDLSEAVKKVIDLKSS